MPYFEPQWTTRWADAAFLHAAKRRDLGRDDALVDADDAVFERLGDAPDAADVAAAASPNSVSLAILMASSSVLKRQSGATGPKVSSLVKTMSVVTSVKTVGSKKIPPSALHLPPVTVLAPFLTASAM